MQNFYPRSPRGERLELTVDGLTGEEISIHAPREGSDWAGILRMKGYAIFLSTLPARGATIGKPALLEQTAEISIHAPREGSDAFADKGGNNRTYFYPRSPRGERQNQISFPLGKYHFYPRSPRGERPLPRCPYSRISRFLSTLPARGATQGHVVGGLEEMISIHAPREGSDSSPSRKPSPPRYFYPRSPRGERRRCGNAAQEAQTISIHAPREGSDPVQCGKPAEHPISIHAPREGSDGRRQCRRSCW